MSSRPWCCLFALTLAAAPAVYASNTAPTRSFTTNWLCENGRMLHVNAHPRRPPQEAQLTYGGSRVELHVVPTASGVRYASKDGKVIWHSQGQEGQLTFDPLLSAPITCTLQSHGPEKAKPRK